MSNLKQGDAVFLCVDWQWPVVAFGEVQSVNETHCTIRWQELSGGVRYVWTAYYPFKDDGYVETNIHSMLYWCPT